MYDYFHKINSFKNPSKLLLLRDDKMFKKFFLCIFKQHHNLYRIWTLMTVQIFMYMCKMGFIKKNSFFITINFSDFFSTKLKPAAQKIYNCFLNYLMGSDTYKTDIMHKKTKSCYFLKSKLLQLKNTIFPPLNSYSTTNWFITLKN